MKETAVEIATNDGKANALAIHPDGSGPWSGVIIYMDAFGVRPELIGMARRLAGAGYYVLLPNLYYRTGRNVVFSPGAFAGPDGEKIMAMVRSLENGMIMRDTKAFLDFMAMQQDCNAAKIGCVGYCMGGPFALSAAGTYPESIAAAASIHGGRLATNRPDSPHRLAPKIRGTVYIGVAGIDPHFPAEEKDELENALRSAHVNYTLEVYPGVKHGFAVNGTPAFDSTASEKHWHRLLHLFKETLQLKGN